MKDKTPARRKRKNLLRQIVTTGLILTGTFVITLLAVPRFIVVPTSTPPPSPTAIGTAPGHSASPGDRGTIYDRRFRKLAVSFSTSAIVARPAQVKDHQAVATELAAILGKDKIAPERLAEALKSEESTVTIARHIDPTRADRLATLKLPGIRLEKEMTRYYPHQRSGAHILGFVEDGKGLDGVEFQYNDLLAGKNAPDADSGKAIPEGDGAHLVLSMDIDIQSMIEERLRMLLDGSGADGATALLLDPRDGAVLALASLPAFDPNRFSESGVAARRNRVITDALPLGRLADILHLAAALERDLLIQRQRPEDADPHLPLIVPLHRKRILAVQRLDLDDDILSAFAKRLGFGRPPIIDLPRFSGRGNGADGGDRDALVPSRATTLEMAVTFAELINGGHRITPALLAGVYDRHGGTPLPRLSRNDETAPATHQVMDKESSRALLEILPQLGQTGPGDAVYFEAVVPTSVAAERNGTASVAELARSLQRRNAEREQSHQVIVGYLPEREPELMLVMTLSWPAPNGSAAMGSRVSPLLTAARELLPRARKEAAKKVAQSFAKTLPETEETPVNHWKIEQYPAIAAAMAQESRLIQMPDVLGKSLRTGLQMLQHLDLRIRVIGTGTIVNQHPRADTLVPAGEECILELHLDH